MGTLPGSLPGAPSLAAPSALPIGFQSESGASLDQGGTSSLDSLFSVEAHHSVSVLRASEPKVLPTRLCSVVLRAGPLY